MSRRSRKVKLKISMRQLGEESGGGRGKEGGGVGPIRKMSRRKFPRAPCCPCLPYPVVLFPDEFRRNGSVRSFISISLLARVNITDTRLPNF